MGRLWRVVEGTRLSSCGSTESRFRPMGWNDSVIIGYLTIDANKR